MQWQAICPKRRLYCNNWHNLTAELQWECGMWLSAEERHKHRQAVSKRLQYNCSPCTVCNTHVIMMVCIHQGILDAKYRRWVWNGTRRLGDRMGVIQSQKVRGSIKAVRAVRNTRVFLTETRVLGDALSYGQHLVDSSIALFSKSLTLSNVSAFIHSKLLIVLMGFPRLGAAFYTQTAHEST